MNKYYSYILILSGNGFGSLVMLLLPILILIAVFIHFKKKKESEQRENNRFGRRGKKDHIWQILKEYHKKKNKVGSSIIESFLFERPHPADFHDYLVRGLEFLDKQDAKDKNIKYKKVKYPKRIPEIEDYFDKLEEETKLFNQSKKIQSHKLENIRHNLPKKKLNRKRYVIFYKTQQKSEISPWMAIEVELIKQVAKDGRDKDAVVVNKELDVNMEFKWIAPLLNRKIEDRAKQKIEAVKKQQRAQRWQKRKNKLLRRS